MAVRLLPIGNATFRRKSIAPCLPRFSAVRFRGAASFSGTACATAACLEIGDLDARPLSPLQTESLRAIGDLFTWPQRTPPTATAPA